MGNQPVAHRRCGANGDYNIVYDVETIMDIVLHFKDSVTKKVTNGSSMIDARDVVVEWAR